MKNKIIITPKKPIPISSKGFSEYMIKLNKNQVDYENLKFRKELKGFREQSERHITIIGDKASLKIERALNKFSLLERKKKVIRLKFLLKNLKWEYVQKDIYLISKKTYLKGFNVLEKRESYIRLVEMSDINVFYRKLNTLLKTRIPIQVPHITLFTKGEYRPYRNYFGISISSKTMFKKLNPRRIY
ncbi:MAG: hypothetical protein ABIG99_02005 [Patescibacteria group bacterium]